MTEAHHRFLGKDEWRHWLSMNHAAENEAWVVIQKVKSPNQGLRYEEAVDEAMCHGWIDGKMRRLNDHEFTQRFSPRRPRSVWSLINRDRAERLISEGRMTEPGLAAVEEAKRNGRWEKAYTSREPPEMPGDLLEALKANEAAHRNFTAFPNSARLMYIHWINDAKRPETRARRIRRVVERAEQGKRPGIDM
ncbi:YdeI/OmpD-associated family protein [Candidatus Bathyarchaeota archaeon]|nr:YdeI/OmpD-associated family protein [Candidatus Bathyarchaeota archaeon]